MKEWQSKVVFCHDYSSRGYLETSEQDKEQTENPSNLLCQSNPDSLLEMGFTKIPKSSILDQEEDKYI